MITRIVAACARRPYVVLAAAALTAAAGYASQRGLARDAIPDLSNPQLVLVAEWMGHSARRGRRAGDRGRHRRARGRVRLDGGARLVDGGHGVRRRRIRVGGGAAGRARRDRPPHRPRSGRGCRPPFTSRSVPRRRRPAGCCSTRCVRRRGSSRCRWARRSIAGRARRSARCASSRTRCCGPRWSGSPASPRWRRSEASVKRCVVQTTDAQLRAAGAAFSDVATALRARLEPRAPADRAATTSQHDPALAQADARQRRARDVGRRRRRGRRVADRGRHRDRQARRRSDRGHRARQAGHRQPAPGAARRGARLGVLYDRSELAGRVEKTLRARGRPRRWRSWRWWC